MGDGLWFLIVVLLKRKDIVASFEHMVKTITKVIVIGLLHDTM